MKKYNFALIYFIVLSLSLIVTSIFAQTNLTNPNASKEAKALLTYLNSISGKYILSGQHNYATELNRSTDSVKSITGKYPAMWGCDMEGLISDSSFTRQNVIDEVIRQYEKGSIITIMYHQVKPFDDDTLGFRRSVKGRVTDDEWKKIVTPGTEYNNMLIEKLDSVANYLKQLRDKKIPILWRPYHEMNGMWFWYGDRKGEDGFVKLWKIIYERYVHHHKLNNLIWVWNPNAPRYWKDDEAYDYHLFYPGDDYVDILATDIYKNDYKQSHHDDLIKLANGKLVAIGECGILPTPEILKEQSKFVWFMDWARFVWEENEPKKVRALYNYEKVLTLDEINRTPIK
ncbi:MAG: glycosyl hydrolase [Melioribacteraceae bacterium]